MTELETVGGGPEGPEKNTNDPGGGKPRCRRYRGPGEEPARDLIAAKRLAELVNELSLREWFARARSAEELGDFGAGADAVPS
jgi:hypothetical protein